MGRITEILLIICALFLFRCEKEINLNLPVSTQELVVEASINDVFPTLNYVYITQTIDYFNPKLDFAGVSGATVFISDGQIIGSDTIFNPVKTLLSELKGKFAPAGFYSNPNLRPEKNKIYKLEIYYQDKYVQGLTYIHETTQFTGTGYKYEGLNDGKPRIRLFLEFFDPPEPSFYRIGYTIGKDSNLIGWGASERTRLLNDETINNRVREYNNFPDFGVGDTINIYFGRFGKRESEFWESFNAVRNSDGPFSTPAQLKSNIKGAIGSFTGYSMEYERVIIR